jgi:hypothetical protein
VSDFLTHLAARTIAQPALRPRTQSRFEPPAMEEAPLVWPVTAKSVSPIETSPAAETPEVKAEREQEKPHATPPAIRNAAPPEQTKNVPPPAIPEREVIASEPRVVHVPRVSTRVVHEVEHDVERVVETNERVVAVPRDRVVESEPRTIIKTARPHRFEHEPPRVIRERQQGDAIHHEREIRTTIDRPPRFVRDRAEPSGAAPRPEPVIEVSIGRIEVRAVSSAAPQRQQPSRNGAMTIDDYVAKRKAKERR